MKKSCKKCNKEFSKRENESLKDWNIRHHFCSKQCKIDSMIGKKYSLLVNMKKGRAGHLVSSDTRRKIADSKRGDKSHFWRGGVTEKNHLLRTTLEYRLWRESVFERDNWTCLWCKVRGGKLNADHIKPFALYPELRLAIDNGRTLCLECHKTTETFGRTYTERERNLLGQFA